MTTLKDLLDNFGLEEEGTEKVAEEEATEEQELLETLEGEEKVASEGGSMDSLMDLYLEIAAGDEVADGGYDTMDKVAELAAQEEASEEQDIEKVAAEYDAAGRIMARGFMDEMNKLARELEEGSDAKTPALGERGTGYQMETNYEDKGKMETKGGDAEHKQILKGKASGKAGQAEGAMGGQFGTVQSVLTSRAKQTNAQ